MKIKGDIRIQAVNAYLTAGTLEKTSSIFKIHRNTLWRWVKWYREGGIKNLTREKFYTKHWRRTSKIVENKVVAIKELTPSLTVRRAQKILMDQGINISIKGVWNIWKKYGYIGFIKEKYSYNFLAYVAQNQEDKNKILEIKEHLKNNNNKKAIELVNSLAICSELEILEKIPDKSLSLQRRLEKLALLYGKINFVEYRKKTETLRKRFEKRRLFYSALRAGILELYAFARMNVPKEQLSLINHLKPYIKKVNDIGLCFHYFFLASISYANLLNGKKTLECAKKCRVILRHFPIPEFIVSHSQFYTYLGDYKRSYDILRIYQRIIGQESELVPYHHLAACYTSFGEYHSALSLLKSAEAEEEMYKTLQMTIRSQYLLAQGEIFEAGKFAQTALLEAKQLEIRNSLISSSLVLAGTHYALGEEKKGSLLIRKLVPLLKKFNMNHELFACKIILEDFAISLKEISLYPSLTLVYFLKKASVTGKTTDYRKALSYAKKKKLMGKFHRLILFFPKVTINLLEKGKPTGIPKTILRLPVFNKNVPVYNIRFLGKLFVYKNHKYIRVKLQPKESAFLIHLILRIGNPFKQIVLKKIYKNFWPHSLNSANNLSHLLVRIRKVLKISPHLLIISWVKNNPVLINRGMYFTTDYNELQQFLAQAKALERAGEWNFARTKYLHAFKLFRGEPFRKNYDNWSEQMRRVILSKLETEAIHFAECCLEHKNKKDAEKVLEKTAKIIPDFSTSPLLTSTKC